MAAFIGHLATFQKLIQPNQQLNLQQQQECEGTSPVVRPNLLGSALQIVTDVAARGSDFSDKYKRYKDGW